MFNKNTRNNISTLIIIIFMILFGLVINDLRWKLAFFSVITVLILYWSNLEVLNPIFWFTIALYLYGIPNTVISLIFNNQSSTYFPTDLDLSIITMGTFFVASIINRSLFCQMREKGLQKRLIVSYRMVRLVLFILVIVYIVLIIYLVLKKIRTKLDLMNTGLLYSLYTNLNILYCLISNMYLGYRILNNKKVVLRFLSLMIINLTLYYYTGERDIIVFPIISTFLIFSYNKFKYIKLRHFIPLLTLGVASLPMMLNFGVRNSGSGRIFNFDSFFYRIFSSELLSASKNLDLIVRDTNFSPLGMIIPISILVSSFIELPFFPTILNFHGITWFNERYYYYLPEGSGAGFSLIVEGYIFYGILGVIIWFTIISTMLFFMYKAIDRNIALLHVYTVMVPVFMYSVRGSMESILMYLVRIIIFYIALFTVDQILFHSRFTNK